MSTREQGEDRSLASSSTKRIGRTSTIAHGCKRQVNLLLQFLTCFLLNAGQSSGAKCHGGNFHCNKTKMNLGFSCKLVSIFQSVSSLSLVPDTGPSRNFINGRVSHPVRPLHSHPDFHCTSCKRDRQQCISGTPLALAEPQTILHQQGNVLKSSSTGSRKAGQATPTFRIKEVAAEHSPATQG